VSGVVELSQAGLWHRQVAALAAAADRAGVAVDQLPTVRSRLQAQQARFAEAAGRAGVGLPALIPTPTEVAAAAPALGDLSGAAVEDAFRVSYSTLDAIDSALTGHLTSVTPAAAVPVAAGPTAGLPTGPQAHGVPVVAQPPAGTGPKPAGVSGWRSGPRNALVYGGYAFAVLVIQLVLLAVVDEQSLPLLSPVCLFVLPAFAWAAGWFTVGMVLRPAPGDNAVKRTPRTGAVICLLPNLLLCVGLGALFIANHVGN
jgi:hypothetical protein